MVDHRLSMNAFTNDATKIAIPMFESGAAFQQDVTSMNVYSTVDGINRMGSGSIEFCCQATTLNDRTAFSILRTTKLAETMGMVRCRFTINPGRQSSP